MSTKMGSAAAVAQLVDMGIPPHQARAALRAAKGDVSEAAEKVFSGQFDDLSEGGGEEEERQHKQQRHLPLAGPSGTSSQAVPVDSDSDYESRGNRQRSNGVSDGRGPGPAGGTGSDEEEDDGGERDQEVDQAEDEDGMKDQDDDDHISYQASYIGDDDDCDSWDHQHDTAGEGNAANDPYAGLKYEKDRVEETIEVEMKVEKGRMWVLPLADGSGGGSGADAKGSNGQGSSGPPGSLGRTCVEPVEKDYEVLPQAAWMSGCPEKGEQPILFQVYHRLTEGTMSCHACTHTWTRKPSDFFAYFPSSGSDMDFESYKAHLASILIKACPDGHHTCFACGTKCTSEGGAISDWWNENNGLFVGAAGFDKPPEVKAGEVPREEEEAEGVFGQTPITPAPTISDDFDEQEARPTAPARKKKGKGKALSIFASVTAGKSTAKKDPATPIEEQAPEQSVAPPCLFHCSDIQGVIVGVGLVMAQKAYELSNETKHVERKPEVAVPAKRERSYDSEDEYAGYGTHTGAGGFAKGTGFSGSATEDRSGMAAAASRRLAADHQITVLLHSLSEFLPRPDREGGCKQSDFAVDSSTIMHLRRRFNAIACTLLAGNSIMDMSDRAELHLEIVEWLLTVAHTEALASMIAMPFMKAVRTERKATDADGNTEILVRYEATESPREVLERVAIQGRHVLKAAVGTTYDQDKQPPKKKSKTAEGDKVTSEGTLVEFCNKIVTSLAKLDDALLRVKGSAFLKRMQDTLPQQGGDKASVDAPKAGDSIEQIKAAYETWGMGAKFDYCDMRQSPDDKQAFDHIFSKELVAMEGSTTSKRSITIAKEMAVLSQHLPVAWGSSVFLRVDDSRPDCIKLLMIGPEDSPYCNGTFVFDLACPADYPFVPPLCKIKSTSGGRMRFGPNLYAEGKVCLSLLGTWSGPGWISGTSTILQVVLSILSLILGQENPIANEPGYESQIASAASKAYNKNVRRMTVRVTMKEAIEDPFPPFKSVVHTHFKLKAREIRSQLDRYDETASVSKVAGAHEILVFPSWEKEDDGVALTGDSMSCRYSGITSKTPSAEFKKHLDIVRGYLDDLEAGREIVKNGTESMPVKSGSTAAKTEKPTTG